MTMRISHAIGGVVLAVLLAAPHFALAGGTRVWELAGFEELDKGEPDGTQVTSLGEVRIGRRARKLDLPEVGLVWCAARGPKGKLYLGTGYDGKIFRQDGDKLVEIATTGGLVVTSLAFDRAGDLYIGALPEATILRVKAPTKVVAGKPVEAEKWASLPEGTKHVWALAFDEGGGTLYVGTGPEGKLFAIGRDAKAQVYLDSEEEQILSLLPRKKGELLVGTSPGAKLLEVRGPGRASALADFEGTEVKAIAMAGGEVFVAVNAFKTPPAIPKKSTKTDSASSAKGSSSSSSQAKSYGADGDGELYRVGPDGRIELLWERKKGHVVSLAATDGWVLYAGLGAEGKVISIDSGRIVRTEIDLDERQVMALIVGEELEFATTGDAGGVYAVSRARKADAVYLSPTLDAGVVSRFGIVNWFARGKLKLTTRSGNTQNPDANWSDWSKPVVAGGLVTSPPARYLQLRFSWAGDAEAVLLSAELSFRRHNLRAVITELDPDSRYPRPKKTNKGGAEVSTRVVEALAYRTNDSKLRLSWKVNNPDEDALRFYLSYRAMDQKVWRPITKPDEVLRDKKYTWQTLSVPEGNYQIRLIADDSLENDAKDVLTDEFISVPVLVDGHQPAVARVVYRKGRVQGAAEDSFSPISGIEYTVDGGPWTPIFCKDGLYDEKREEFDFELPNTVEPGPHAVAVRAYDRSGNMGTAEIHIETK